MDDIVYQQIRNEMTALFTSFMQLQIGQYGLVAAFVTTILTFGHNYPESCIAAGLALIVSIIGATYLGGEWHAAGTRLGGYLLLAYELPHLQSHDDNHQIDRKKLWILANRAEPLKTVNEEYSSKNSFRTSLKNFYLQQLILTIFSLFIILISVLANPKTQDNISTIWICVISILSVWNICSCACKRSQAKDLGKSQIKKWNEYLTNRVYYDQQLLDFMGLEIPNNSKQTTR